jgi:hypothetical protein
MVSGLKVTAIKTWLGCWVVEIWTDLTFQNKLGFWQNFAMTSQNLCIQKMSLMNSASRRLLIRPIPIHGFVATAFWSQVTVLNCFGQLGHWNEITALGGPKRVDLDEAWLRIPYITFPALQRLLKHTISVTTATVMAVQGQHSRGASGLLVNYFFDGWKQQNNIHKQKRSTYSSE